MENRPIGRGKITGQSPKLLVENQGLDALEKDKRTGMLYADHLLFSMLVATPRLRFEKKRPKNWPLPAWLRWSIVRSLTRDLQALDKLFGMHTLVYSLGEDGKVELVHRPTDILSKQQSQAAFRLNFYGGHFSYVKHLAKYS